MFTVGFLVAAFLVGAAVKLQPHLVVIIADLGSAQKVESL
jgi:hypothetical protein